MPVKFKFSTKPEKIIAAATAAIALSLIFDQSKLKAKGSKKYCKFPKRVINNYKKIDGALKKTLAKDLYDQTEHFNSEMLENLTIENGEFIDI
ncbi:MAG: hypothetical protein IKO27_08290 [Ruminococcus sp.]|nr:hypothetical protein [Ruminococcus sp.]